MSKTFVAFNSIIEPVTDTEWYEPLSPREKAVANETMKKVDKVFRLLYKLDHRSRLADTKNRPLRVMWLNINQHWELAMHALMGSFLGYSVMHHFAKMVKAYHHGYGDKSKFGFLSYDVEIAKALDRLNAVVEEIMIIFQAKSKQPGERVFI